MKFGKSFPSSSVSCSQSLFGLPSPDILSLDTMRWKELSWIAGSQSWSWREQGRSVGLNQCDKELNCLTVRRAAWRRTRPVAGCWLWWGDNNQHSTNESALAAQPRSMNALAAPSKLQSAKIVLPLTATLGNYYLEAIPSSSETAKGKKVRGVLIKRLPPLFVARL